MPTLAPELSALNQDLKNKVPIVALLAPSFPVVFDYPQIVGKLKRLGFSYVIEVARGAMETNQQLLSLLQHNPTKRYITSPCPTIVQLIKTHYPHLVSFLTPIDSPVIATAKFAISQYPGFKPVFIGPCLLKKLEAQSHPELNLQTITFNDLEQLFLLNKIKNKRSDFLTGFDQIGFQTRLYPLSGGLTQSARLVDFLADDEFDVVSGTKAVNQSLADFPHNHLRVLDILNCDGGCISGPGITSSLTLEKRREKIIIHWAKAVKS